MRPNAVYYITKCLVPSLSRLLALAGADVEQWWSETARDTRSRCAGTVAVVREEGEGGSELMRVWGQGGCVAVQQQQQQHQKQQQRKIENYMQSDMCCVCDLNHAQVVVSSLFLPAIITPTIATIVIESPPPLSSAFDAIVCCTYDC